MYHTANIKRLLLFYMWESQNRKPAEFGRLVMDSHVCLNECFTTDILNMTTIVSG